MNIMPLRMRLDREKKRTGLLFETIQQDYLLSWILFGLCEHPSLKENLIFKGGTALKKCYFGNYRFSEDLDFSTFSPIPIKDKLLASVIEACKVAEQKMNEFGKIRLVIERYEEKDAHPFEQEAFKVRAQFPWHREPLISAMIEISMQETVLFPPVKRQIIHPYEEKFDALIQAYSLEEIVLEKLRAILQKTKKLHEEDAIVHEQETTMIYGAFLLPLNLISILKIFRNNYKRNVILRPFILLELNHSSILS